MSAASAAGAGAAQALKMSASNISSRIALLAVAAKCL